MKKDKLEELRNLGNITSFKLHEPKDSDLTCSNCGDNLGPYYFDTPTFKSFKEANSGQWCVACVKQYKEKSLLETERQWLLFKKAEVGKERFVKPDDILLYGKEECLEDMLVINEGQLENLGGGITKKRLN